MKKSMALRFLMGLDDVERWGNKPKNITDRVGQHSRRVRTIATLLVCIFQERASETRVRPLTVMLYSEVHDAHEFYTGDAPGYLKLNHQDGYGAVRKEFEDVINSRFFEELPPFYREAIEGITSLELQIVKLADLIDAFYHSKAEIERGLTREYEPVVKGHLQSISEFTDLQWVVERFFELYDDTLEMPTSEVFDYLNLASLQ